MKSNFYLLLFLLLVSACDRTDNTPKIKTSKAQESYQDTSIAGVKHSLGTIKVEHTQTDRPSIKGHTEINDNSWKDKFEGDNKTITTIGTGTANFMDVVFENPQQAEHCKAAADAFEEKHFPRALDKWQECLTNGPKDSRFQSIVRENIALTYDQWAALSFGGYDFAGAITHYGELEAFYEEFKDQINPEHILFAASYTFWAAAYGEYVLAIAKGEQQSRRSSDNGTKQSNKNAHGNTAGNIIFASDQYEQISFSHRNKSNNDDHAISNGS